MPPLLFNLPFFQAILRISIAIKYSIVKHSTSVSHNHNRDHDRDYDRSSDHDSDYDHIATIEIITIIMKFNMCQTFLSITINNIYNIFYSKMLKRIVIIIRSKH